MGNSNTSQQNTENKNNLYRKKKNIKGKEPIGYDKKNININEKKDTNTDNNCNDIRENPFFFT